LYQCLFFFWSAAGSTISSAFSEREKAELPLGYLMFDLSINT